VREIIIIGVVLLLIRSRIRSGGEKRGVRGVRKVGKIRRKDK
jgi:hypothetical protein